MIHLLVMLLATYSYAGSSRDNGGHVVFCEPLDSLARLNLQRAGKTIYEGHFAFDFLAIRDKHSTLQPVPIHSTEESFARTKRILAEKVPGLLPRFEEFTRYYRSEQSFGVPRVWHRGGKILTVKDYHRLWELPENCPIENIRQGVRRIESRGGPIQYNYDAEAFEQLADNSLVDQLGAKFQESLIAHHEFLWEKLLYAQDIYDVNKYLHSTRIEEVTSRQVVADLRALGLDDGDILAKEDFDVIDTFKRERKALLDEFHRDYGAVTSENVTVDQGMAIHDFVRLKYSPFRARVDEIKFEDAVAKSEWRKEFPSGRDDLRENLFRRQDFLRFLDLPTVHARKYMELFVGFRANEKLFEALPNSSLFSEMSKSKLQKIFKDAQRIRKAVSALDKQNAAYKTHLRKLGLNDEVSAFNFLGYEALNDINFYINLLEIWMG